MFRNCALPLSVHLVCRYSRFSEWSWAGGHKYMQHFALLSDEWSCQTNSPSFQSYFLPRIPQSRTKGSCENWKWQSNQHVEQADWTKLSWPRSELFNTRPIRGLSVDDAVSLHDNQNLDVGKEMLLINEKQLCSAQQMQITREYFQKNTKTKVFAALISTFRWRKPNVFPPFVVIWMKMFSSPVMRMV